MNSIKWLVIALVIFAPLKMSGLDFPKEIVLAASGDSMLNEIAQAVGDRVFGKYNIKFTLKNFPKARALVAANSGEVDGDAYRVYDFHKRSGGKFPNLTLVNSPFMTIYWTAFVTDKLKDLKINGWEDMKKFRVAGIRGNKTMELRMKDFLSENNRFIVTHYEQAFGMLFKGRVDIVVGKPNVGISYMKKHKNLHS